jgi:Ca2+-binding EF-hand superfamily protein
MKAMEWKIAGLAMAIIGAASLAQAEQGQGKDKGQGGGRRMPPHVIEKFDTDGDGQLNEKERAAAREARKAHMQQFDTDGDGKLNEEERETMRAAMEEKRGERPEGEEGKQGKKGKGRKPTPEQRKAMMEKYDADGDGQLSEEERETMKADWKKKQNKE